MTALLITEVFPPEVGGSGRWFWELYRRLPRDQAIILAGTSEGCEAFDRGHDLRVVRSTLAFSSWGIAGRGGRAGYRRVVAEARRLIAAEEIDEVHCGKCLPEGLVGLATLALARVPYVCYVHGEELGVAESSRELRTLTRVVLKGSRRLIANSRNTRDLLQDRWGVVERRIAVVHPGVDTSRYSPAPRSTEARRRLGWGPGPVLLTVGRLEPRKGHDRMIGALTILRRRFPEILYCIIGDGESRPALERQAESAGLARHVRFLGRCPEETIVSAYQQCDLFVLPNREIGGNIEGFGIVLIEAQACGRPVLAGESGGTAETMEIPVTGRVVPCDAPEALAGAVADLLADPGRLERMGRDARRWAVEQFDWEAVAGDWRRAMFDPAGRAASASPR